CYTELLIDNVQIPDEEEFDDSITNIAERNEVHESESNDITLKDLLSNLALQIDSEKTSKFNINRRNIWDGARRAFLRKTYKATNRISVMFTDSSGNSEGAEKGIEEKSDLVMWLESEATFSSNSAESEYPVKEDSSDPLNVSNYTATAVSANMARESTLQVSSSHSVLSEGFDDH
ncbi:hypothetical protein NDU88_006338, partial [Pleurodeles waltl]